MYKIILYPTVLFSLIYLSACSESNSDTAEKDQSIPVRVEPVKRDTLMQSLHFKGDVEAQQEVKIYSKIADRIEAFYVDESDYVKRGDKIAQVEATKIEQAVIQAEASLAAARTQEANQKLELARAKRLYQEEAMSKQHFDAAKTRYESAQAQVQQAEAALKSAKSQLQDATITATISGVIGDRFYETGDMANPQRPLATIVKMDRVKITFDATETDLGKLAVGQKAYVRVRAFPEKTFRGEVIKISPVLDPQTRMAEIEVLVQNREKMLKPGMYASVEVVIGMLENVIVVPRYAIIEQTTMRDMDGQDRVVKNYYVFTTDSGYASQRQLQALYVNHKKLAVEQGISVGDQLVVAGQNNLRDGMAVNIISEEGREQ